MAKSPLLRAACQGTHVLLVVCVDVPHEYPEGVAAQLAQLQGAAAELKVAQPDATQPAQHAMFVMPQQWNMHLACQKSHA